MGFHILPTADDKEASAYQEERYVQKKGERKKKLSIKKHNVPHFGLGGLRTTKSANHVEKNRKKLYME
jgi:hypothetical protein